MRLQYLSSAVLFGAVSHAFSDTFPLFAFISSSTPSAHTPATPQEPIALASDVESSLVSTLQKCPTDAYVFVSQPNVTAADFSDKNAAPHLRRFLTTANDTSNWRLMVPEVAGSVHFGSLQQVVAESCGASTMNVDHASGIIKSSDTFPLALTIQFPTLSKCPKSRPSELLSHDSFLNTVLGNLSPRSYTVIYTTASLQSNIMDAAEKSTSHPQFDFDAENHIQGTLHTDLKRDLRPRADNRTQETPAGGALFETYAFLSPGIFMGFFIAILLFLILYVGVTAIGSLEIPVYAFSKEMGPAAQKNRVQ